MKYLTTRNTIVFPILGALSLLKGHKKDPGLNIASAIRAEEWAWSTYTYKYEDLGPFRKEVHWWLMRLQTAIQDVDFSDAKSKDGWNEAMHYYNSHECPNG